MSIPPHTSRSQTARERIAARRAALRRQPPRRPGRRTRRSGCGPLGFGLAALLVVCGLLATVAWSWARSGLTAIEQNDPRRASAVAGQPATLPQSLRDPFNILLVGVDRRDSLEEGVRSDTLILVHVNPAAGWAGMLSIPRDSIAELPNLGAQKINTAYAHGFNNAEELYGVGTSPEEAGGAFAAETVEGFLGLHVDYIAQIDFRGFERVVNTLGGVSIDVPQPLLDPTYPTDDYGYERLYVAAGLQVLDGPTALRYARSRHSSSDFDRSRRQQQVLRAILDEVRARGLLNQAALLPNLARNLEESVRTTLPLSDIDSLRGLAALAQSLGPERIVQLSINPDDVAVLREDGSDIYWDRDDLAALVTRLLAGPDSAQVAPAARIQVQNGAEVQGLAGRVTQSLIGKGFVTAEPADAPDRAEHSMLIDYSGNPETLGQLAEWLGIDARYVYRTPPAEAPPPPFRADIVLLLGADYLPAWAGELREP